MNKYESTKGDFTAGGSLFVIGILALSQGRLDAALFLMGLGLVVMAPALGKKICEELFHSFLSFFKEVLETIFK